MSPWGSGVTSCIVGDLQKVVSKTQNWTNLRHVAHFPWPCHNLFSLTIVSISEGANSPKICLSHWGWKSGLINPPPPRACLIPLSKYYSNHSNSKYLFFIFTDGQVPVVCMYIEGGSASITHACISVENDLPIVAVNHSGRAANVLSMAFKSDGLKRYVHVGLYRYQR